VSDKHLQSNNEAEITERGFFSEVIPSEPEAALKGVISSNAKLPDDIDLCIVKTIDVTEEGINATGTRISYSGFQVKIPKYGTSE